MSKKMLKTEIDSEGFAVVTIDMPGRSMNVIDWHLSDALDDALTRLLADDAVKGIVIASGKSSFIAGADLAIMKDFVGPGTSPSTAGRRIAQLGDVFRRIEKGGKPVVAAASGTALGGGLELMLACHYRIAAANPKARFGLPEVKLGLLPGGGGTQRLPRLIGIAAALPLLVEGRSLTAEEAAAAGFIDAVVPAEDLIEAAKAALRDGKVSAEVAWDQKGFSLPGDAPGSAAVLDLFTFMNAKVLAETGGNYPAPKAILSCVFEGARLPIDKALKIEQDYFGTLVHGEVAQAMIRTLFFARLASDKAGRKAGDPDSAFVRAGRDAYIAEGLKLAEEGVSPAFIENASAATGMAKGPLALARESGRELPTVVGEGALAFEDVRARLLAAQAVAAAKSFAAGEGADDPVQADLDAVVGWGFPAWTGGPLSWIDRTGTHVFVAQAKGLADRFGERFVPPPSLVELASRGAGFHGEGGAASIPVARG